MIRIYILTLFVAIWPLLSQSQNAADLRLTSSDIEGMEETRFAEFAESSLWGYINGGADLYLEYGFEKLMVQNLEWESEPFKIDAYIMESPEAAFGIFSVSRFSCKASGVIGKWDCINPYQVQVVCGSLYLSVVAYSSTDRSMELATKIAQKVVRKFDTDSLQMPLFLTANTLEIDLARVKYITGPLAIQNAYTTMELPLYGHGGYKLWVAPYTFKNNEYEMIVAYFKSPAECESVNEKIILNDGFYTFPSGSKLLVVVGEAVDSDSEHIAKIEDLLKVL
jgi:hypothetical protein